MTEREAFAHAIMAWAHENQIGDDTPYPKVTTHALAYKLEELVPSFDYYGYIGRIRADLLRSEIEKLEGMKKVEFVGDLFEQMGMPSAQKSVEDFLQIDKARAYNTALTSIITRYKEELLELEKDK